MFFENSCALYVQQVQFFYWFGEIDNDPLANLWGFRDISSCKLRLDMVTFYIHALWI